MRTKERCGVPAETLTKSRLTSATQSMSMPSIRATAAAAACEPLRREQKSRIERRKYREKNGTRGRRDEVVLVGADLVVPLVILDCSELCVLGGKRRALPPVNGERGLLLVGGELGGELGSTHRRHITWTGRG